MTCQSSAVAYADNDECPSGQPFSYVDSLSHFHKSYFSAERMSGYARLAQPTAAVLLLQFVFDGSVVLRFVTCRYLFPNIP